MSYLGYFTGQQALAGTKVALEDQVDRLTNLLDRMEKRVKYVLDLYISREIANISVRCASSLLTQTAILHHAVQHLRFTLYN